MACSGDRTAGRSESLQLYGCSQLCMCNGKLGRAANSGQVTNCDLKSLIVENNAEMLEVFVLDKKLCLWANNFMFLLLFDVMVGGG